MIEYPKDLRVKKIISLSKDEEQALMQYIYMNLKRKTAGILIALFTGLRIGELCGLQMCDISLIEKTITVSKTVQRIYDKKDVVAIFMFVHPKLLVLLEQFQFRRYWLIS